MSNPIRILICDDHAVVREGLRALISTETDMEVVAEAADGEQAIAAYRTVVPDVALVDMVMPRVDGLETIRTIKGEFTQARILVLTSFAEDDMVFPAIKAVSYTHLLAPFRRDTEITEGHRGHGDDPNAYLCESL